MKTAEINLSNLTISFPNWALRFDVIVRSLLSQQIVSEATSLSSEGLVLMNLTDLCQVEQAEVVFANAKQILNQVLRKSGINLQTNSNMSKREVKWKTV